MRYPASEKLEIIRLVEQSHLPAKCTLAKLGISLPTPTLATSLFAAGKAILHTASPPGMAPKAQRLYATGRFFVFLLVLAL